MLCNKQCKQLEHDAYIETVTGRKLRNALKDARLNKTVME